MWGTYTFVTSKVGLTKEAVFQIEPTKPCTWGHFVLTYFLCHNIADCDLTSWLSIFIHSFVFSTKVYNSPLFAMCHLREGLFGDSHVYMGSFLC